MLREFLEEERFCVKIQYSNPLHIYNKDFESLFASHRRRKFMRSSSLSLINCQRMSASSLMEMMIQSCTMKLNEVWFQGTENRKDIIWDEDFRVKGFTIRTFDLMLVDLETFVVNSLMEVRHTALL